MQQLLAGSEWDSGLGGSPLAQTIWFAFDCFFTGGKYSCAASTDLNVGLGLLNLVGSFRGRELVSVLAIYD